ncbi:MAG: heavy metal translocating P-type ATPase [Haloarculaceae archaeon]
MTPPEDSSDGAAKTEAACDLCGLPVGGVDVTSDGRAFCCTGCREVADALGDVEGLEESDVRDRVAGGDEDDVVADGPSPGHERAYLRVDGMYCTTCEAFLESVAGTADGVDRAEASYVTETLRVDYDPETVETGDLPDLFSRAGYTATNREDALAQRRAEDDTVWRLGFGALVGMFVMIPYLIFVYPVHFQVLYSDWMLQQVTQQLENARYPFYVIFVMTSLVLFYTGWPLLQGAYVSLRAREPNMNLLVSLAAVGAYLYSVLAVVLGRIDIYFDVSIAIVLVVTAGTYYESQMKRKATDRLSELTAATVDTANRYVDGATEAVPVDSLSEGDRVLVREGERVPVDGTVVDGECTVDEAVVTGESLPVQKTEGEDVVGGSVLTDGAVVVEVGEGATSSVDRIASLVWNLQSDATGVQKLADRLAVVFVPGVLALATLAGLLNLGLGATPTVALLTALTVLIVSCPCALGLATPLAVASGIREALARSVVVFDDSVFERLREAETVVFDKTGTLTTGEMRVVDATAPDDALAAAGRLEARSSHPIAAAVASAFDPDRPAATDGGIGEAAPEEQETEEAIDEFRTHGTGVGGRVDGTEALVGHPDLFETRDWALPDRVRERATEARESGHVPVVVGRDGAGEGVIVVGDEPRESWEGAVADLAARGIEVVVLTGDEGAAAEPFREHPAVDEVFAGVPPEGKAATVRQLGRDRQVAMVGDGTNDAPALASADLGVAMGGGTALAADAADVAIVDDDVSAVGEVFDLAEATRQRVRQNIGWAFVYNGVAIPLAIAGLLNPLFAAAAMATSSLLVVTNSTRPLLGE